MKKAKRNRGAHAELRVVRTPMYRKRIERDRTKYHRPSGKSKGAYSFLKLRSLLSLFVSPSI